LQVPEAVNAQAAIVQFAYILHLVNAKLHIAALAFGVGISLAFKSSTAAVAMDGFMLLIFDGRHSAKIKSPEVINFRAWSFIYV